MSSINKTNSINDNKKTFSLLWNLATENTAKNNKGVIAIPLDKDIRLGLGKYGFRKMLIHRNDMEAEIMEVIFDEKDVKERKYSELYEMGKFNGKLILYDLKGKLKTGFTYKMGKIDKIISLDLNPPSNVKSKASANQSSNIDDKKIILNSSSSPSNINLSTMCWSEYIDPMEGVYWPGCDCSDEGRWVRYCIFVADPVPWIIDFAPSNPTPGGGGGGGGSVQVDPNFYGFYGSLPDPCNVDPNSPVTVICNEQIFNRKSRCSFLRFCSNEYYTKLNY